jgi:glycosyltransferase involved in cell wall biosynthesis
MIDTIKAAQQDCNVLNRVNNLLPCAKNSKNSNKKNSKLSRIVVYLKSQIIYYLSNILIHKQNVDRSSSYNADLVYMWGAFPRCSNKNFIIELDNPYVLTYYSYWNFYKNKNKLKKLIDKAYKIVCLSEACKNHLLEEFDNNLLGKISILYPYMESNYQRNTRNDSIINFIFVGLNYRLKGVIELLEAFHDIKNDSIRLTLISDIDEVIKNKYRLDKRIIFLPTQSREKLFCEIYPKMDILILPSFYESFGVVLLEALSFGMGIIAVNNYAVPEMVINDYNGKLLKHPILTPEIINNQQIVNCVKMNNRDFFERYLANKEFYENLYNDLKNAINDSLGIYKIWQRNSIELFEKKFSSNLWHQRFKEIMGV